MLAHLKRSSLILVGESGKILNIRKNTPDKFGKILPKNPVLGGKITVFQLCVCSIVHCSSYICHYDEQMLPLEKFLLLLLDCVVTPRNYPDTLSRIESIILLIAQHLYSCYKKHNALKWKEAGKGAETIPQNTYLGSLWWAGLQSFLTEGRLLHW